MRLRFQRAVLISADTGRVRVVSIVQAVGIYLNFSQDLEGF